MLRIIKTIVLAVLLIGIILVAVANREPVVLNLVPDALSPLLPVSNAYELPLFLVVLVAVMVGLLIGYLFEWLREHKHRVAVREKERKVRKLEKDMNSLRRKTGEAEDEVLTILN